MKNCEYLSRAGNSTCRFGDEHILYSRLRPYLNKVVVPDEEGYATTEMIPLKPNPASLNRDFLAQLLRSDEFVEHATNCLQALNATSSYG